MSSHQVTMMGAGVRVAAASTVLLGGLLVAMLFRHESSPISLPPPETGERLVLRKRLEPQRLSEAIPRRSINGAERATAIPGALPTPVGERTLTRPTAPTPTLLKPLSCGEPPPVLAKDYPGDAAPDSQGWASPLGLRSVGPKVEGRSARVHKIVDGDTLGSLAERYLGSADRFREIYEANRDLLSSPEILPIGAELRIPRHPRPSPSPSNLMPQPPLVPVAGGEDAQ